VTASNNHLMKKRQVRKKGPFSPFLHCIHVQKNGRGRGERDLRWRSPLHDSRKRAWRKGEDYSFFLSSMLKE